MERTCSFVGAARARVLAKSNLTSRSQRDSERLASRTESKPQAIDNND